MYLFEAAQGSESGSAFSQQVLQALFTFLRSYAKAKSSQAIILATSAANGKLTLSSWPELSVQW